MTFFESAILNFFFSTKIKFASSPWKLVTNYVLEWMGLIFYDYDGLQPKITPPQTFQPAVYDPPMAKITLVSIY